MSEGKANNNEHNESQHTLCPWLEDWQGKKDDTTKLSDKVGESQPGSGKEEVVYMGYVFELSWVGVKSSQGSQGTVYGWVSFQVMEKSKWMAGFEKRDGSV